MRIQVLKAFLYEKTKELKEERHIVRNTSIYTLTIHVTQHTHYVSCIYRLKCIIYMDPHNGVAFMRCFVVQNELFIDVICVCVYTHVLFCLCVFSVFIF
jgi:hypothetical protein